MAGQLLKLNFKPGKSYCINEPSGGHARVAREFRRLLRLLLCQAMGDGMSAMRLILHSETSMDYYGPARSPDARWWAMVGPPVSAWNALIQTIVEVTHFDKDTCGWGSIRTRHLGRSIAVRVHIRSWTHVTLAWDDMAAVMPAPVLNLAGHA